jgi:hypothetical protein
MTNLPPNIFDINLGDWSNDGHGKTKTRRVSVPAEFTLEMIAENYRKNCAKYEVNLGEICSRYEDNNFPLEALQKMVQDGLDGEYLMRGYDIEEDESVRIIAEDFFTITCHLFFYGMPDSFTWQEVKSQGVLVGGYSAVENSAGYGLFF